jgi:hypothetical protein
MGRGGFEGRCLLKGDIEQGDSIFGHFIIVGYSYLRYYTFLHPLCPLLPFSYLLLNLFHPRSTPPTYDHSAYSFYSSVLSRVFISHVNHVAFMNLSRLFFVNALLSRLDRVSRYPLCAPVYYNCFALFVPVVAVAATTAEATWHVLLRSNTSENTHFSSSCAYACERMHIHEHDSLRNLHNCPEAIHHVNPRPRKHSQNR